MTFTRAPTHSTKHLATTGRHAKTTARKVIAAVPNHETMVQLDWIRTSLCSGGFEDLEGVQVGDPGIPARLAGCATAARSSLALSSYRLTRTNDRSVGA